MQSPVLNCEQAIQRLSECEQEVRFALSELLEAHLGRRVELVTTEALSPFLGPRILAEAQDVLRAA